MSLKTDIDGFLSASSWPKASGSSIPSGSDPHNYFRASDTLALTTALYDIAGVVDSASFTTITGTTVTGSTALFNLVDANTGTLNILSGVQQVLWQTTGTQLANVANNSGSVAHIIDTAQALDSGSKILSVRNAGVEFFSVRSDGYIGINQFTTGSVTVTGTQFADRFSGRTGTCDLSAFGGTAVRIDASGRITGSITGSDAKFTTVTGSSATFTTVTGTTAVFNVITGSSACISGSVSGKLSSTLGCVAALYNATGSTSFSNGVLVTMNYDTKDVDTHNAVTTGPSWKFALPSGQDGLYTISCGIVINGANWLTLDSYYMGIAINGAERRRLYYRCVETATFEYVEMFGTAVVRLTGTDYVNVMGVIGHVGGVATPTAFPLGNYVSIYRIPGS
jgi:hypothetical protein